MKIAEYPGYEAYRLYKVYLYKVYRLYKVKRLYEYLDIRYRNNGPKRKQDNISFII